MSTAWLQDLEERVREASDRLREQKSENESLRARIDELEAENEGLRGRSEELERKLAGNGTGDGDEAWTRERDEIRQRVEKLAEHLAELLAE